MPRYTYTQQWRDKIRPQVQSSAGALVPVLVERYCPTTVIDVGCGEGWFVNEFIRLGCDATGVDGDWVEGVGHVDLSAPPYPDLGRFDMAVCLEVAEHLPAQVAPWLVHWLTTLAPLVVFSAAIPGQGGVGHVNEQPPGYWRHLFSREQFKGSGALRWVIWDDDRIEPWYRQNLLIFDARSEAVGAGTDSLVSDGCPFVIHPEMWAWKGHG